MSPAEETQPVAGVARTPAPKRSRIAEVGDSPVDCLTGVSRGPQEERDPTACRPGRGASQDCPGGSPTVCGPGRAPPARPGGAPTVCGSGRGASQDYPDGAPTVFSPGRAPRDYPGRAAAPRAEVGGGTEKRINK